MRNHLSIVLLSLALIALVWDIAIRSQPVHAQSSAKVYVDKFVNNGATQEIVPKGTQIVGFSCSPAAYCYVLSK
jgi:hypothetical protein